MMRMDAEAAQETAAQADAGFLWDFWYPAVRSTAIRGQKLVTAMLLEVPLVLGRTSDGKAFAMRDSCPHRGIPLSYGRLDGKVVECCYHGWRFDACSGQCVEIPSLSSQDKLKVERIFAGHYPCEERDGYVWVYMNSPGARLPETIPAAPALTVFSDKYKITYLSCDLPSHIDHGIIGLMDPAHGPFVHQSWFWRKRGSIHEKAKQFEPIPNGFRMSPHSPSTNSAPYQLLKKITGEPVTTTIDFVLPNIRTANLNLLDFGIYKTFELMRGMNLQVRIEAINALNYTVLWNPDQNPRNATFGLVNQDRNNPRDVQVGARLRF